MIKTKDFTENTKMENKLLQAITAHYTAKLHRAEANLMNYFKNPAGIGEHPDIVEEMIKQIDEIASARDGLDVITSYVAPSEPDTTEESN